MRKEIDYNQLFPTKTFIITKGSWKFTNFRKPWIDPKIHYAITQKIAKAGVKISCEKDLLENIAYNDKILNASDMMYLFRFFYYNIYIPPKEFAEYNNFINILWFYGKQFYKNSAFNTYQFQAFLNFKVMHNFGILQNLNTHYVKYTRNLAAYRKKECERIIEKNNLSSIKINLDNTLYGLNNSFQQLIDTVYNRYSYLPNTAMVLNKNIKKFEFIDNALFCLSKNDLAKKEHHSIWSLKENKELEESIIKTLVLESL